MYFKGRDWHKPIYKYVLNTIDSCGRHWSDSYYLIWDEENKKLGEFGLDFKIRWDTGIVYSGFLRLIENGQWIVVPEEEAKAEIGLD